MLLQLLAPPLPSFISGGEDTYEIGQHHPSRQNIGVFDLLVVTKGALLMGEDHARYQVKAGETLILFPESHHYSTKSCDETTHFYWLHFTSEKKWVTISPSTHNKDVYNDINDDPFTVQRFSIRVPKQCKIINWDKFEHLCKRIIFPSMRENSELDISWEFEQQLIFQQLLQELSNNIYLDKLLPTVVVAEKAAAYIRRNYTNKINYKDLGEALHFHPNHIARCMIEVFGHGPSEYVNRFRIEQAKSLLIYTDWTIERIAENCGFFQLAYFSRLFKKKEGITPNNFRKRHIEKISYKE